MTELVIRDFKQGDSVAVIHLWRNGLIGLVGRLLPTPFKNLYVLSIIFLLASFTRWFFALFFAGLVHLWTRYIGNNEYKGWYNYLDNLCPDMKDEASIVKQYMTSDREHFFVADLNGKIVGCVGVVTTPDPSIAELKRMSVDPKIQRMGIGKKLYFKVEQFCKEKGYKMLELTTSGIQIEAQKLYESVNMIQNVAKLEYYEKTLAILTYEKKL